MMKRYVFYNNITGDIHFIKKFTERQAMYNCNMNNNVSCILESELGYVLDKNKQKIDLDTMTLVAQPMQYTGPTVSEQIRHERNLRLKICDWTQAADSPLSDSKKAEWATYRQALRDIPSTYSSATSIRDVVWPTKPS